MSMPSIVTTGRSALRRTWERTAEDERRGDGRRMTDDHVDVLPCRERGPERRPLELDVPDGVVLPVPAHAREPAEERAVLVPAWLVESQEMPRALDVDRPCG